MIYTATYSPDDNKLRLSASQRLDPEDYARAKAAGFAWAPKQGIFVAPRWTPEREDLCIELAGEVTDEDTSLIDRAEMRAERFEEYSDKREAEANSAYKQVGAIAERFADGQPILVGHHSEKRARKDKERIENGMSKAVKLWDTSNYWTQRAAAALAHAKYKERPDVRARRIKTIEAELRSEIASYTPQLGHAQILQHGWDSDAYTPVEPHAWCGPKGRGGRWVPVRCLPILEQRAQRWIAHYQNRLAYERAMLEEAGGLKAHAFDIQPGGQIKTGSSWYPVVKANKRDGKTTSVSVLGHWSGVIQAENITDYRPPQEGAAEKVKKATTQPPLCNWRAPGCVEMTMAKWKDCTRWSDTYYVATFAADHTHTWGRAKDGEKAILYRQRTLSGGGSNNFKRIPVFITDAKEVLPPAPPTEPRELVTFEGAGREPQAIQERAQEAPAQEAPAPDFEKLRDALKAGVQVVSAPQLFPTPPEVAARAVDLAGIQEDDSVLEPSAGTGNLITAVRQYCQEEKVSGVGVTAIEVNSQLCDLLRGKFYPTNGETWNGSAVTVMQADFLDMPDLNQKFDVIIMNPPFGNAADIKHIQHARTMLAPGGRLVAICAGGPRQFEALKGDADYWEELPAGTFDGTQVRSVLLRMTAPQEEGPEQALRADWTARGVTQERQDALIAEITRKAENPPTFAAKPDPEHAARIDAERVTAEWATRSARRTDNGRESIEDSPLFGGPRQGSLFDVQEVCA